MANNHFETLTPARQRIWLALVELQSQPNVRKDGFTAWDVGQLLGIPLSTVHSFLMALVHRKVLYRVLVEELESTPGKKTSHYMYHFSEGWHPDESLAQVVGAPDAKTRVLKRAYRREKPAVPVQHRNVRVSRTAFLQELKAAVKDGMLVQPFTSDAVAEKLGTDLAGVRRKLLSLYSDKKVALVGTGVKGTYLWGLPGNTVLPAQPENKPEQPPNWDKFVAEHVQERKAVAAERASRPMPTITLSTGKILALTPDEFRELTAMFRT